jgi:tRNA pseudouridine-54 N-methylase
MSKQVTLQANLFTSSGFDSRSTTKQILDAIDATILGSATAGQLSMSVAGRSIQRMSLDELINAKSKFESLVAAEKSSADVAAGKPSRNTIQVRFK